MARHAGSAARRDSLKRAAGTPTGGGGQSPVTDPDFDGKTPGDVWRQMCRAEKWLESRGYVINLSGEYREVKIRKLKKE